MKTSHLSNRQQGLTSVEFAICGAVYFMVLFSVIEVARFMYALNVLDEVTRRGARLASVCPVTQPAPVLNTATFGGRALPNLGSEHLAINYFSADNTVIADPVAGFVNIAYVQVSITNYNHQLLIPFLFRDIQMPPFSTTVLAESLGISPPDTGTTSC